MTTNIRGHAIWFKRAQDSQIEYGYRVNLYIYPKNNTKNELIYDDNLNLVTEYFKYFNADGGGSHSLIECDRFVSWDMEKWDERITRMVTFTDNRKYPILRKDEDKIVVLDEKLIEAEIYYKDPYYKFFQQL